MSQRPWPRALAWLAFLGPFFFLTYNLANAAAARRAHVPVIMFPWERHIPFVPWTILPYWLTDVFYALSLALCRTRAELDLHAKRLLAIQVFCIACFLLFPLRCAFDRQPVTGWEGSLFAALRGFDQPFNQAPSLHIGLAAILWTRYRVHTKRVWRRRLSVLFFLMAASTLTTHQHQFIDVPTGLWAGLLVIAALPERPADRQIGLTLAYLAGALVCTIAAFHLQGFNWFLLWPGFALSMVAAAYWTGDPIWLGVGHPVLALLMLPHRAAAWINSRLWTLGEPARNHLRDAVWIGRAPSRWDAKGIISVVDLAPELFTSGDAHVPMLDLVPPTAEQLDAAVEAIMSLRFRRPTLVCCALGYSRSAVAAAAWLIAAGHAADAQTAIEQVRRARPHVVVRAAARRRLDHWVQTRNGNTN